MKLIYILYFLFVVLFACGGNNEKSVKTELQAVIYEPQDSVILENVLEKLRPFKDSSTATLLKKAGNFFIGTPYVAHTLESEKEQLIINFRGLDCTTYAENCLALAHTVKSKNLSLEQFAKELKRIRYREGKIEDYFSRLHYFSDWIFENEKKGFIQDVSQEIADTPYKKSINFMSIHPESYAALKVNKELVQKTAAKEEEISSREMFYIPESKIRELQHLLQDGDIAGITTNIEGLDVSHVVILVEKNGKIYPMHASSAAEKVVVDELTLEEYLNQSKSSTGIMVARPL